MDIYFWYIVLMRLHELRQRRLKLEKEALDMQQELDSVAETAQIITIMDTPENALTYEMAKALDSGIPFNAHLFEEANRIALANLNLAKENGARPDDVRNFEELLLRNQYVLEIAREIKYRDNVITPEFFAEKYNEMLDKDKLYTDIPITSEKTAKLHEKFSVESYYKAKSSSSENALINPVMSFVEKRQFQQGVDTSYMRRRFDATSPRYAETMQAITNVFIKNNDVMDSRKKFNFNILGVNINIKDPEFQKIINSTASNLKKGGNSYKGMNPEMIGGIDNFTRYLSKQAFIKGTISEMHHVHLSQIANGEIEGEAFVFSSYSLTHEGHLAQEKLSSTEKAIKRKVQRIDKQIAEKASKLSLTLGIGDISVLTAQTGASINESLKDYLNDNSIFPSSRIKNIIKQVTELQELSKTKEELMSKATNLHTVVDLATGVSASEYRRVKDKDESQDNLGKMIEKEQIENILKSEQVFQQYDNSIPLNFIVASGEIMEYTEQLANAVDTSVLTQDIKSFPDLVSTIGKHYSQDQKVVFERYGMNHSIGMTDFVIYEPGKDDYLILSIDSLKEKTFFKGSISDGFGPSVVDVYGNKTYPNAKQITSQEANDTFLQMNSGLSPKNKLACTSVSQYLNMSTVTELQASNRFAPALAKTDFSQMKAPNVYEELNLMYQRAENLHDYHPFKILTEQYLVKAEQLKVSEEYYDYQKLENSLILLESSVENEDRLTILKEKMEAIENSGRLLSKDEYVALPLEMANIEKYLDNGPMELSNETLDFVQNYLEKNETSETLDKIFKELTNDESSSNYPLEEIEVVNDGLGVDFIRLSSENAITFSKKLFLEEEKKRLTSLNIDYKTDEDYIELEKTYIEAKKEYDKLHSITEKNKELFDSGEIIKDAGLEETIFSEEDRRMLKEASQEVLKRVKEPGLEDHFGLNKKQSVMVRAPQSILEKEKRNPEFKRLQQEMYDSAMRANQIDSEYLNALSLNGKSSYGIKTHEEYNVLNKNEKDLIKKLAEADKNEKESIVPKNHLKGTLVDALINEDAIKMEYARAVGNVGNHGRNLEVYQEQNKEKLSTPKFAEAYAEFGKMFEGDRSEQRKAAARMLGIDQKEVAAEDDSVERMSNTERDALIDLIEVENHGLSDRDVKAYQNAKEKYEEMSPEEKKMANRDKNGYKYDSKYEDAIEANREFDQKLEVIYKLGKGHFLDLNPALKANHGLSKTHKIMSLYNKIELERARQLEAKVEQEIKTEAIETLKEEVLDDGLVNNELEEYMKQVERN